MIAVSEEMKNEDLKDPSNMEQEVSEESASENTEASAEEETKEKEHILQVLKQTGGHKRNAAKLLGISKSTLYNKLRKFNLSE